MNNFYQVLQNWQGHGGWRLYFGDEKSVVQVDGEINGKVWPSVAAAKAECWRRFHEVPIRVLGGECKFDPTQHDVFARLEARHSSGAVVAVGPTHYLVRRSKFRVEVSIEYRVSQGHLYARQDVEPLVTGFTETVQHSQHLHRE